MGAVLLVFSLYLKKTTYMNKNKMTSTAWTVSTKPL